MSHKVIYASKIIDPVINEFSTNEVTSNFDMCDQSIVTFGMRGFCLGFSHTSHVDSLDMFRKSAVDKAKRYICI